MSKIRVLLDSSGFVLTLLRTVLAEQLKKCLTQVVLPQRQKVHAAVFCVSSCNG